MRWPSSVRTPGPLAKEQVAAELVFELLDGARQRRLRDIALIRRTREILRACDRQKVADLVHFHREIRRQNRMLRHTDMPHSRASKFARNGDSAGVSIA